MCCCLHDWTDHDPGQCTGQGCTCRGFHKPGSPALCRALHEKAPVVEPVTREQIAGMMWARLSERVEQVEAYEFADAILALIAPLRARVAELEISAAVLVCTKLVLDRVTAQLAEAEEELQVTRHLRVQLNANCLERDALMLQLAEAERVMSAVGHWVATRRLWGRDTEAEERLVEAYAALALTPDSVRERTEAERRVIEASLERLAAVEDGDQEALTVAHDHWVRAAEALEAAIRAGGAA